MFLFLFFYRQEIKLSIKVIWDTIFCLILFLLISTGKNSKMNHNKFYPFLHTRLISNHKVLINVCVKIFFSSYFNDYCQCIKCVNHSHNNRKTQEAKSIWETSLGYCGLSPLVTTGDILSEKILLIALIQLILKKIKRSQIIWKDFLYKESKQACKNCKKEES